MSCRSSALFEFGRFAIAGLVSAIGHFGLLIALVQLGSAPAVLASAAGALLGAWINYWLNYHFTFRSARLHRDAFFRFAIVAVAGLVLNTLAMWVGVELVGLHYLLSQVFATSLVFIWSFLGNRYWTFHSIAKLA